MTRPVPGSPANILLFGADAHLAGWLLWLRQPRTAQRR
ncbi:hypothetical protein M878_00590 [Streptomyces roseochromogenus subsp. oscitans DS 12.976]|uniref:Uncharacterized protein n=1 Tax=Streptomyces roseochromogenus subsp. oscitans DS 12.976 TaxID=1352936 RepID=V6KXN5_STRRC|nr:hypothetical protein M878_00590 [Streptomyces roseochromogenus subsp. oscitans DS 12.976]